jgi:hypothetical protein
VKSARLNDAGRAGGPYLYLVLLVVLGLAIALGIGLFHGDGEFTASQGGDGPNQASESAFNAYLGRFVSVSRTKRTEAPYVQGKMLVIDVQETTEGFRKYAVDVLQAGLPLELRAVTPQEVGTVLLLRRGKKEFAHYDSVVCPHGKLLSVQGFVQTIDVSLIDRSLDAIIYTNEFRGSPPPEHTSVSCESPKEVWQPKEVLGDLADQVLLSFLLALPRRNTEVHSR